MTLEINSVILGGNLTKDVVIKDTPAGRKVCMFTVANNRTYLSNNQKVQETSFVDIEVWGNMAENCSKYLKKGSPVVVVGRLKQERWDAPTGEKRSRFKVVAANVQFLYSGGKKQTAEATATAETEAAWDG